MVACLYRKHSVQAVPVGGGMRVLIKDPQNWLVPSWRSGPWLYLQIHYTLPTIVKIVPPHALTPDSSEEKR